MNYVKIKIKDEEFMFIGEYEINSAKVYKFANKDKRIFCSNENGQYVQIKDKKRLKEIEDYFRADTDVIF